MLVSELIINAINEQIGNEFSAMLQYTVISAYFAREALPELAAHFARQAEEEKEHAHRFIRYVVDTGATVRIPPIPASTAEFKAAETAVKLSLDQEKTVTSQINSILHMAKEENDYITDSFLQWFVKEQLEEVSSMDNLLTIVRRAGEDNLLRVEEYLAREYGHGAKTNDLVD